MNRPEARTALSEALIDALGAELDHVAEDGAVRAVVLTGRGPAFSAVHDLKEIAARRADSDRGRAYFADLMARCSALMQRIVRLPQPAIAAVEGIATAAGCQLVASCDLAVAGAAARFATPGAHIGLFCSTPMVALSRNLARKHAMEMLLLGETISAADAHRFGLVNRVVPAGATGAEARRMAGQRVQVNGPRWRRVSLALLDVLRRSGPATVVRSCSEMPLFRPGNAPRSAMGSVPIKSVNLNSLP